MFPRLFTRKRESSVMTKPKQPKNAVKCNLQLDKYISYTLFHLSKSTTLHEKRKQALSAMQTQTSANKKRCNDIGFLTQVCITEFTVANFLYYPIGRRVVYVSASECVFNCLLCSHNLMVWNGTNRS